MPGASKADAADITERLRRRVQETSVVDGEQTIRVTISLGVTAYPELSVEGEDGLVQKVDEALYSAKETGRNSVIVR